MLDSVHHLFWAKLGAATWPAVYHPVICHLIDVGLVARHLWNKVLRAKVRSWVTRGLEQTDESAAGVWLAFWAATHDIGKIAPCFQHRDERTSALRQRLENDGFNFPVGEGNPHGNISTAVLAEELASPGGGWPEVPKKVAQNIAVAVGGHHGIFPTNWDQIIVSLGNERWTAARRSVLAELARLFGVTQLSAPRLNLGDDQSVWMFVAGLTSVADWIGSDVEFFQPIGTPDLVDSRFDVDEYFEKSMKRAAEALEGLGWLGRAETTAAATFAELFPLISNPRPLQTAMDAICSTMSEPGLMIVEAPMGEGKTEAAWYAAACWDRRGGQGTYVALPTMATSNQMFGRVGDFLKNGAGKKNLMLQHGKALLNERFQKLKYQAEIYDNEKHSSAVVAEAWFAANKKHNLLAPYGVGTIDQALLAVLQTKHVFVRLFGLAGKCVILDEVHAYDAYMTTLLERLLRWLAALRCPVVLLSATLPKERREALIEAYSRGLARIGEPVAYPRVTVARPGTGYKETHVEADKSRERTVELGWLAEANLIEKLRAALANGGCAAVIRNTVGLAQETYLRLRDALMDDGIMVELFHARFPFGRRQQIETEVLEKYGKGPDGKPANPKRPEKAILVATQVIEQSLDLDFDLMVSDLAPVDLVLQRAGRLWRHQRDCRLGRAVCQADNAPLWIIAPTDKDGVPDFGRGSEFVYAKYVLLRSLAALQSMMTVNLPGDLERLVEQVYGNESLALPSRWETALTECCEEFDQKRKSQRRNAKGILIRKPDAEDLFEQQSMQLDDDNPEVAEKIRAATRDTEPTISLIVVYRRADQDFLDPDGTEPFDEHDEPTLPRIRRLLDNEVTIGHIGCFFHYLNQTVPAGWRKCGMLRYHRVARVDPRGTALEGEFNMCITRELGVQYMRKEKA